MSKSAKIFDARRINKMRWIMGIVMSSTVIVATAVMIVFNVTNFFQEENIEVGFGTLRMFTTLSNIIAAIAAFMCLPFQIQGLKKNKYKLPSWIVLLFFVGATGVFLSFFIAITILSITKGFLIIMFQNSNLFMHTICPILVTLTFVLVLSDVRIKFRFCFLAVAPVALYSLLYYIMVFALGVWEDHYEANAFIPWPITLLLILAIAFGIAALLRFLHNLMGKHVSNGIKRYYLESEDYELPRISDAMAKLAQEEAKFYAEGDDIYIPTDIIALLSTRYSASIVPVDILYDIYLESFLRAIKKPEEAK